MKDISGSEYLLEHLSNLGWCASGGMGATPLTFLEIKAYSDITFANITPDEALLLKRMSQLYVGYSNNTDPNVKMPS